MKRIRMQVGNNNLVEHNIICGKMYVALSIVCFYEIVTYEWNYHLFMLQDKLFISNSTSIAAKYL
jgi:hypothetical protein